MGSMCHMRSYSKSPKFNRSVEVRRLYPRFNEWGPPPPDESLTQQTTHTTPPPFVYPLTRRDCEALTQRAWVKLPINAIRIDTLLRVSFES